MKIKTTEQFFEVATAGWQRYGDVLDRTSFRTSLHEIDAGGKATPPSISINHRIGSSAYRILTLDDGEEWLFARNAGYAFHLSRSTDLPTWRVDEVVRTSEMQASQIVSRYLRRSFYPDFLFRQDSLLDAIKKPYFKLLSVEHEPTDSYPQLYRVEFDYEHPYQPTQDDYLYNWVQNGTLWLDAANCWVIVKSQVEFLGNKQERSWHSVSFEFGDVSEEGVRLPTRKIRYYDLPEDWNTTGLGYDVLEYERISQEDFQPEILTLSHYGFSEPIFESAEQNETFEIALSGEPRFPANGSASQHFTIRNFSSQVAIAVVRVIAC